MRRAKRERCKDQGIGPKGIGKTDYVLSRAEDAAKKGVEVEIIRYAA